MRRRLRMFVPFLVPLVLCLVVPRLRSSAQDAAATPRNGERTTALATPEPDSQLCVVAGTVTSLATGEPLKKVDVTLTAESPDKQHRPQSVVTDAAGHFSIDHIPPGRYEMAISRDGYLPQRYAQENGQGPGAVLSLGAGQRMTDLIFKLQKTAVITGRVVDEDGEPMIRVPVEVLRRRSVNGTVKFEPLGSESTDDQGTYRVFGLSPGRYFVRVRPEGREGSFAIFRGDSDDEDESAPPPKISYAETYYPGTTDSASASAIDVKAGDEIPRIDFFMTPREAARTYRIRGHVTNMLAGQSEGFVTVLAMPRNGEDLNSFGRFAAQPNQKTNNFEIAQVPPGSYTVAAVIFGGGRTRAATQEVEVINADVDSVSLVLTRGVDISGRVTFDGPMAATSPVNIVLQSQRANMPFLSTTPVIAKPDGSFTLTEVADGSYSIHAFSQCRECYLESATANGIDLLEQGVLVGSGNAPTSIDLVYSSNTGKASGTVTRADDLPVPGAYVVLVKDNDPRAEDDQRFQTTTTDQYGKFEISGIPPGRYKAIALAKGDSDSYTDPDFIKPYAAKADSVDVRTGSTASLQLKVNSVTPSDQTN
jgi:protocatechuate 3,4-dioxygenase beta subunit